MFSMSGFRLFQVQIHFVESALLTRGPVYASKHASHASCVFLKMGTDASFSHGKPCIQKTQRTLFLREDKVHRKRVWDLSKNNIFKHKVFNLNFCLFYKHWYLHDFTIRFIFSVTSYIIFGFYFIIIWKSKTAKN